jgi:hypothetical protein
LIGSAIALMALSAAIRPALGRAAFAAMATPWPPDFDQRDFRCCWRRFGLGCRGRGQCRIRLDRIADRFDRSCIRGIRSRCLDLRLGGGLNDLGRSIRRGTRFDHIFRRCIDDLRHRFRRSVDGRDLRSCRVSYCRRASLDNLCSGRRNHIGRCLDHAFGNGGPRDGRCNRHHRRRIDHRLRRRTAVDKETERPQHAAELFRRATEDREHLGDDDEPAVTGRALGPRRASRTRLPRDERPDQIG